MSTSQTIAPVRLTIEVKRPLERTFSFYTEHMADWWPLASHSVGGEDAVLCAIEGRVGGRVFERTTSGVEHLWGTVLAWEPPHRLVHSWHPAHPGVRETEISVTFTALDKGTTQVTLEHRGFEIFADRAETMRSNYDEGWSVVLGTHFSEGIRRA